MQLKNLLLSVAIGDISGMPYEFGERIKDYHVIICYIPITPTPTTQCAPLPVLRLCFTTSLWQRVCGREGAKTLIEAMADAMPIGFMPHPYNLLTTRLATEVPCVVPQQALWHVARINA